MTQVELHVKTVQYRINCYPILFPKKERKRDSLSWARFINGILLAIQIRWKLAIRSEQILHMPRQLPQLPCHVQRFLAITLLKTRREQMEISIEFELRLKNSQWHGLLALVMNGIKTSRCTSCHTRAALKTKRDTNEHRLDIWLAYIDGLVQDCSNSSA